MAHVTAAHHVRNLWRGLGQRQKHQRRIRGDDYTGAIVPLGLSAVKGCVARRGERAVVHPCKQPCAGMWDIPAHSFRLGPAGLDQRALLEALATSKAEKRQKQSPATIVTQTLVPN